MNLKEVNANQVNAVKGKSYIFTYNVEYNFLASILSSIISALEDLYEVALEYSEGKQFEIVKVWNPENTSQIKIQVKVLSNPAPLVLIGGAIAGILFLFGSYLVLSKVEEIVENPVIGGGFGILLVAIGFGIFAKIKSGLS